MKRTALIAAVAAIAALIAVKPAHAQFWRFDLGVNGGGSWYSSLLDDDHLGEGVDDLKFKSGWLTGAQATLWLAPNWGIRANGTYTERPLEFGDVNIVDDVNLWSASGDLMFRFVRPSREFSRQFLPYLALGIGAKFINPAGNAFTAFTDSINLNDGGDFSGVPFLVDSLGFFLGDKTKLMGLVALGGDVRIAPNFAVRLEVGDRFYDAPIFAIDVGPGPDFVLTDGDEDIGNVVHEIYGQLGLHLLMGLQRVERVAVAPAPPPPPAPPAPVEERITVCVIDPTMGRGVRNIDAIYLPAEGDTLVVVNGQRVALETAVGDVMVARNADWFVRGQPLTMHVAGTDVQYVTFGSTRLIDAEDLALVGTMNGLPIYADADQVASVREELAERSRAGMDLDAVLNENANLRKALEDVDVLYVPTAATGCVFQPLERVEEVRKVRG